MIQDIHRLILREARLLDEGKLDDWLALYAEDATYWAPIDENADPRSDSSIIYDNRMRLALRVEQLARQMRLSQSPPSDMLRMISNVDIAPIEGDTARATFAMLLLELRSGDWRQSGLGETRLFPAHCEAAYKRVNGEWLIQHKKIILLNRKLPIVGLSFIL